MQILQNKHLPRLLLAIATLLTLTLHAQPQFIRIQQGPQTGFIDTTGKVIFPFQPGILTHPRHGWIIHAQGRNPHENWTPGGYLSPAFTSDSAGIIDLHGQVIIPIQKQYIGYWGDGLFWTNKGGKINSYCFEPLVIHGGEFSIHRHTGQSLQGIQDITPGLKYGLGLLRSKDRVALIDSTMQLRTAWDYDMAMENNTGQLEPPTTWLWALHHTDGHWDLVAPDGSLTPTDWPSTLPTPKYPVRTKRHGEDWLFRYLGGPRTACPGAQRQFKYLSMPPKGTAFAQMFPDQATLDCLCDTIVAQALAPRGLEIRHRKDKAALARIGGRTITPYGTDRFEPTSQGRILRIRPYTGSDLQEEENREFETFDAPSPQSQFLVGLIDENGRELLPPLYQTITVLEHQPLVYTQRHNGSKALFGLNGRQIAAEGTISLIWAKDGVSCWHTIDGIYQLRDPKGKVILTDSSEFSDALHDHGRIFVRRYDHDEYHVLDTDGHQLDLAYTGDEEVPRSYAFQLAHPDIVHKEAFVQPLSDSLWTISTRQGDGICDNHGRWRLPIGLADVIFFDGDGFLIGKNGKEGYADAHGRLLIQPEYDEVTCISSGYFIVERKFEGQVYQSLHSPQGKLIFQGQDK